jgi:hypothetical protein
MTGEFQAHPDSELEPPVDTLHKAAIAIGGATAASGLGLIAAPRLALRVMGAGTAEPSPFLFRIIGMFMTVSGGLLADGTRASRGGGKALRWAMVAKIGAAIGVGWGVRSKRFGKQGLALAVFDAAAASLIAAVMLKDS